MGSATTARDRDDDSYPTDHEGGHQVVFIKVAWLALAGACGTVSRFALCEMAARSKAAHLPLGTFTVNIIGSFLFGFIYAAAESRLNLSSETRIVLLTGFLGAFTTFSTFAFEAAKLLKSAQWALAFGAVTGQILLGLFAVGAGVFAGRLLGG